MQAQQIATKVLSLIDLTSLNSDDTEQNIEQLCNQAVTQKGRVAAVCVYPQFVACAKQYLKQLQAPEIKIATVTNFPGGDQALEQVLAQTRQAICDGADEIDLVMPYSSLMLGDMEKAKTYVEKSKALCGDGVHLKVIIESGELKSPELIRQASEIAIRAGADFIKTSTGKVPVNATLEAAEIMLGAIERLNPKVGFKAAGGIRTLDDALSYLTLADKIMGQQWVSAEHFRFGASALLDDVLLHL